jgi:hypothetical protein
MYEQCHIKILQLTGMSCSRVPSDIIPKNVRREDKGLLASRRSHLRGVIYLDKKSSKSIYVTKVSTDTINVVVERLTLPTSYSGGPGFESQPRRPTFLFRVFVFSSVPPGEYTLKSGHELFLPNPFQLVIIHLSFYYRRCIV